MHRTIIVPTDFSEVANRVLPFAADLARRFEASVFLLHVLPAFPTLNSHPEPRLSDYERAVLEQAEVELHSLAKRPELKELSVETRITLNQPPAPAVIDAIREEGACLVVISSHGRRGSSRVLLGSVAEEIIRTSQVPVLTVGGAAQLWRPEARVLVPVDFSPSSVYAVEAAARLAQLLDLQVHLAHVVESPQSPYVSAAMPEIVEPPRENLVAAALKKLDDLGNSVGLAGHFQSSTTLGGAKERILRMAESLNPALIVMGSHGRRGLGRVVLGSVAEGVVRESLWPTLIVKDTSFLQTWPPLTSEFKRKPASGTGTAGGRAVTSAQPDC